jgi:DNA-binding CsgD family transcriptional regulator
MRLMAPTIHDLDLSLLDGLAVPASVHDVDGMFVDLNAAAERAAGVAREVLLEHDLLYMLPPDGRPLVEAHFRRAVDLGQPTDFETIFVDGGGNARATRSLHLPLTSQGVVVGVLILAFEPSGSIPPPDVPQRMPRLTPRQQEILELIGAGLATAEIARSLGLSTQTVRNHVRLLMRELGAHRRPEAIAAARRFGLLPTPALGPALQRGAELTR